MAKRKQPMQPIYIDKEGVVRFQSNKIVDWLFATQKISLNEISAMCQTSKIPKADQMQFWQMLGYSVSGFGDLSFVDKEIVFQADMIAEQLLQDAAHG
jgi:hypothetical protein